MLPFRLPIVLASVVALAVLTAPGAAARQSPDPLRFVTWPIDDARGLVSGVSGAELLGIAGFGILVVGVSRFDRPVTTRIARIEESFPILAVEEFGNARVVLPMSVVVFTGALLSGDSRFQDTAFTSIEALVFANLVTGFLKVTVGRSRPHQEEGPSSFDPFTGRYSFPSGHATTAFAALTPWFLSYPGPLTAGLMGLAGAAAFSRMVTNQHWLSDVVAGSAIGFATAFALTRRHVRLGTVSVVPALAARSARVQLRF